MEENKNTSERLVGAVGDWIETYRNLITVRVVEHASQGASVSILSILTLLVVVFVLFFFRIRLRLVDGRKTGKHEGGILYRGRSVWRLIDYYFDHGQKDFDSRDPKFNYQENL